MPHLIKIDTQEYPVSLREFRERFKNTSFPPQFNLEDFGYAVVFDVPQPAHTHYQYCREIAPEISALGKYQQVWEVVDMTQEQKDAVDVAEAAIAAEAARVAAKAQDFADDIPSWAQVSTAVDGISNLADAKAYIKKLSRVVYWLAKDKQD
jgi:hypothetical protein